MRLHWRALSKSVPVWSVLSILLALAAVRACEKPSWPFAVAYIGRHTPENDAFVRYCQDYLRRRAT